MSNLRIAGLVIGLTGLLVTFFLYRGSRWKRGNFLFLTLFNLSLITVSISPDTVNFLQEFLAMKSQQRGRLISLLIASSIFLTLYSLYTRSRLEVLCDQFDKLVRKLGTGAADPVASLDGKMKAVMLLIPALNEADNLKELLPCIPERIGSEPIGALIVDDGSEDSTREVVSAHGFAIVSNMVTRGGGAAIRLGYDVLQAHGCEICITMDADGQHRPDDIQRLLIPILEDRFDFVIGSRLLGSREKDSRFRLIGVHFFGGMISLLMGKKITDPSSGFRAFRMNILNAIQLYEDQYHTSELIIEAIKNKVRVGEVPITILKRKYGRSKKGRDWKYALHFARVVIGTWWR